MKQTNKRRPAGTELNTIGIAPLALAKGAATTLVRRVRQAVDVVQTVRSNVKSVSLHAEPMRVDVAPKVVNRTAVLTVPMGLNDVAVLGGVQVQNVDNTVTLSMKVDAYLIDRLTKHPPGQFLSSAAARFNTELRVELRETIDAHAVDVTPRRAPKRLTKA